MTSKSKASTLKLYPDKWKEKKLVIGIDEAGRGPLLGRVYVAGVVLPSLTQETSENSNANENKRTEDTETKFEDTETNTESDKAKKEEEEANGKKKKRNSKKKTKGSTTDEDSSATGSRFAYEKMKDSKRFHSRKKLDETAEYIKKHAPFSKVMWMDEKDIDKYNILSCTLTTMQDIARSIIQEAMDASVIESLDEVLLLVDGNSFKPLCMIDKRWGLRAVDYELVTKGDNTYACIAAASIIAKSSRDKYIDELCDEHPELDERYKTRSNKGYGSKAHMDGLLEFGTSQWHRLSFGPCKSM